jgi:GNAT superfamily N-acetyltransferase
MTVGSLEIADAEPQNAPLVLAFIRELADYEKLSAAVRATEDDVRATLFGGSPQAFARIAWWDGEPAGFALFFHNYSTFVGRRGLYVEDVFVREAFRGRGVGKALFADLARIALSRGCARMEWAVLDWNEPAIAFYRALGAKAQNEWTVFRLDAGNLERLAES